ncbi:MAG: DUF349 domain-containing protein [Gammaproteobacteria bacterium]|nr:DUF349 domain-containing protein [Gammaproteobacteria bacterium]
MMFLKELFAPKWQSRKAQVRLAAVAGLDPAGQRAVLENLAVNDPESAVRAAALHKLHDLALYRRRAVEEGDAALREQYRELCARALCGQHALSPELAERLRWLEEATPAQQERAAREGREVELRRRAMTLCARESLYAELAIGDAHAPLRAEALALVTRPTLLERIAREARGRDKLIAREAKARFEALQPPAEHPEALAERVRQLAQGLEALSLAAELGPAEAALAAAAETWSALQPELARASRKHMPQDLPPRAERALARAERHIGQLRQQAEQAKLEALIRQEREGLCQTAERLRGEILADGASELRLSQDLLDTLLDNWRHAPAGGEAWLQALEQRFRAAIGACEQLLLERPVYLDALAQAENLLAELAVLVQADAQEPGSAAEAYDAWKRTWRALPVLKTWKLPTALRERQQALAASLEARATAMREGRESSLGEVRRLLSRFEHLLNAGRSKALRHLHAELLQALSALDPRDLPPLQRRIDSLQERLAALQDWRVWAALPRKEALCADLEALAAAPLPPREQQQRLRELQGEWRLLGPTEPEQDAALQVRYEQALEQAMAPVKTWRAEEEARTATVEAAREALCAEAAALAAGLMNEAAQEWRALEQGMGRLQKAWSEAGHLPKIRWDALNLRFREALKPVEAALRQEQAQNAEHKLGLIVEAEALLSAADRHEAAEAMKALQARWKAVGRAAPRREQELWERFRGIADQVFAERQKVFDARREADDALGRQRAELCEAFAAALGADAKAEVYAELDAAWRELPGRESETLRRRWAELHEQRKRHQQDARQEAARQRLALFERKSALCRRVELAGTVRLDLRAELDAEWKALPELPAELERALAARWEACAETDETAWNARCAQALVSRRELALRGEILAELASPTEVQAERMRLQVEMLAERLRDGQQGGLHAWLMNWLIAGPASAEQAELDNRFQQIMKQAGSGLFD